MPVTAPTAFAARAGRRVLVVEDDVLIAQDLAWELEERGAVVMGLAATVAEALELLAGPDAPDLAVLDIRLSKGLSYPLADELERRGIPFVFVTGYEPWEIPSRFAHVACWQKPLEREAFSAILSGWAAGTSQARGGA